MENKSEGGLKSIQIILFVHLVRNNILNCNNIISIGHLNILLYL